MNAVVKICEDVEDRLHQFEEHNQFTIDELHIVRNDEGEIIGVKAVVIGEYRRGEP